MKGKGNKFYRRLLQAQGKHLTTETGCARTQAAAELAHHAVWVRRGDLGKACEDEDIAVFERSLVHGLQNQRTTFSNLKRDDIYKQYKKENEHIALSMSSSSHLLTSSDEVCH